MTSAVTPHVARSSMVRSLNRWRDVLPDRWLDGPSNADVAAVATVFRLVDAELQEARTRASELEAANARVPEIMEFELFNLKLQFESLPAPGVFATAATKQAYASALVRLEQERQAALESCQTARTALEEVRRIRANPVAYARDKIRRERPALMIKTAALLEDACLVEQARAFNRKKEERSAARAWGNFEHDWRDAAGGTLGRTG